jgi:hypothetical protein
VRGDSISRLRKKFPYEPAFLYLITVPLSDLKEGGNYELWLHDRYYTGSKWQLKWRRNGVCQVMR